MSIQGVTDVNGEFTFSDIKAGLYNVLVEADNHGKYTGVTEVKPGDAAGLSAAAARVLGAGGIRAANSGTTSDQLTTFLPRDLVKCTWKVVPTSILDKYDITLEATLETHVPAPVLTFEPAHLDATALTYDSTGKATVDYVITNHGLIAANGVTIGFDKSNVLYSATPLMETVGTLPARSSVVVPVVMQRLPNSQPAAAEQGKPVAPSGAEGSAGICSIRSRTSAFYFCGVLIHPAWEGDITFGPCPPPPFDPHPVFPPPGGRGGIGDIWILNPRPGPMYDIDCDCFSTHLLKCVALDMLPGKCSKVKVCISECAESVDSPNCVRCLLNARQSVDCIADVVDGVPIQVTPHGLIFKVLKCTFSSAIECKVPIGSGGASAPMLSSGAPEERSYADVAPSYIPLRRQMDRLQAVLDAYQAFCGQEVWNGCPDGDEDTIIRWMSDFDQGCRESSDGGLLLHQRRFQHRGWHTHQR